MMARSHIDVMLVDGDLPDNSALTLCAEVSSRDHPPRIIVLSASAEAGRIVAAVDAGAVAWVRKDESGEHLLHVIGRVRRGETWVPPAELGQVFRLLLGERERMRQEDPLAVSPAGSATYSCTWLRASIAKRWPSGCISPSIRSGLTCRASRRSSASTLPWRPWP